MRAMRTLYARDREIRPPGGATPGRPLREMQRQRPGAFPDRQQLISMGVALSTVACCPTSLPAARTIRAFSRTPSHTLSP